MAYRTPDDHSDNWSGYRRAVLADIERLGDRQLEHAKQIADIHLDVATLKVKWATAAGVISIVVSVIVSILVKLVH